MRRINDEQLITNSYFNFFEYMAYEQFNFHFDHNHNYLSASSMLSQTYHISAYHLDL